MTRLLIILLIICISNVCSVEKVLSQDVYWDIQQQLLNDDEENIGLLINSFEELEEVRNNPIDINNATKEELEIFPFLNDKIIENILYYIYRFGPMISLNELLLIEDIDRNTINMLLPFLCIKKTDNKQHMPSLKNMLKYGKNELSTRFTIPLYKRKGYIVDNGYTGKNYYNNIRYSYKYGQKITFGLTAEKDYGEPFFCGRNKKGYDYYSFYFMMKNVKRINTLAIGNYRLNYGYGMVMNMDMCLGKSSSVYTVEKKRGGIKKHSSTDEYNYLRGIAISYKLSKRINIDFFYSYRKMDGTVNDMFITSLKKDGYHRLNSDYNKKNTFTNSFTGSNLNYNGKYIEAGVTAVYNVFNKMLNPNIRYYNKFYPRGKEFFNSSVYYKLFYKNFSFMGELAIDKNGALATINMLTYSPNYKNKFVVMNRFYDVKYQSIYARSISENSLVQNESAVFIGLENSMLDNLKISGYIDFFYFPNKKYLVEKYGAKGYDFTLQTSYSPFNKLSLLIRYKHKKTERNYTNNNKKSVLPYIQRKFKMQVKYNINSWLSTNTNIEGCMMNYKAMPYSKGFLLSQSFSCKLSTIPVELYFHGAYFDTDDYSSRFTLYERDVLYSFSMPSFYYNGFRGAFYFNYSPFKNLTFYGKYSVTCYKDRDTIGSYLEMISGNVKSDINLMLRYVF